MHFESPISGRVVIEQKPMGKVIQVKSKMRIFILAFLIFWFCGWSFGGLAVIGSFLSGVAKGGAGLFLLAWLGAWAVGWLFAVSTILWLIGGKETLTVSRTSLTKRISIPVLARNWHYNPAHITNIRRNPIQRPFFEFNYIPNPLGKSGLVAFDYGQKTVTFGVGLDDAEADFIVDTLKRELGQRNKAA